MIWEKTIGDIVGKFCGEKTDGSSRTNIIPMVSIPTHTIDSRQRSNTIPRNGNPR